MSIPPEGRMSIPHFRSIRIKDEIKTTTHATHNNKIMHGFINISLSLSIFVYISYLCVLICTCIYLCGSSRTVVCVDHFWALLCCKFADSGWKLAGYVLVDL